MDSKLLKNFLYQATYQITLIILPIITIPIVSRALQPSGIGTWNYVNSIVTYFSLAAGFGLSTYAGREISRIRGNRQALSQKFWELEGFSILISSLVLVIYVIFSLFQTKKILFLTQVVAILGTLLDISWFFRGIEDFKKIVLANILIRTISFICIVLFVKTRDDLLVYFIIQGSSNFLAQFVLWSFVFKFVDFVKVDIGSIMKNLGPSIAYFIPKIANQAFLNLNKTLLGLLSTMAAVGIFSSGYTIVNLGANLMNSLSDVVQPRMSNIVGQGKQSDGMRLLDQMLHFQLFMTIAILFGILGINSKMIGWFFGPSFEKLRIIVPLMTPLVVFQSLHNFIANAYLIPKGKIKSYNVSVIESAIFSVVLAIILIPVFGIYGGVGSVVGGYGMLTFLRCYILVKETTFRFRKRLISKYLVSGLLMALVVSSFGDLLPSSPLTTILQIFLGILIYLSLTILLKANPLVEMIRKGKKRELK